MARTESNLCHISRSSPTIMRIAKGKNDTANSRMEMIDPVVALDITVAMMKLSEEKSQ